MISNKEDLKEYLKEDKRVLGKEKLKRPRIYGDNIWKYQIFLRKHEYYSNIKQTFIVKMLKMYYAYKHYKYGVKLGFSIPINVFGKGLRINHFGCIVVNENAKVGDYCDMHQGVNIGQNNNYNEVPTIGNGVFIAPGVKMFGKIKIADKIAIGANSVVNKSFLDEDITITGSPAKKIKDIGTSNMMVANNI